MKNMNHYESLVDTIGGQKDCIAVALAVETLAFHNKNFLDRTLTDDCDRSMVMQILLSRALIESNNSEKHKVNVPSKLDVWAWLQSWVDSYEKNVGDGKAKEFLNWVNLQPMGKC